MNTYNTQIKQGQKTKPDEPALNMMAAVLCVLTCVLINWKPFTCYSYVLIMCPEGHLSLLRPPGACKGSIGVRSVIDGRQNPFKYTWLNRHTRLEVFGIYFYFLYRKHTDTDVCMLTRIQAALSIIVLMTNSAKSSPSSPQAVAGTPTGWWRWRRPQNCASHLPCISAAVIGCASVLNRTPLCCNIIDLIKKKWCRNTIG